jgi:mono/diheme cytochrome c family protein
MPTPDLLDPPDLARSLDRHYMLGLTCMALLILAFPIYRMGEPTRRRNARVAVERESIALGKETFIRQCAACHGMDAAGGSIAPTLASREFLSVTSDQQLHWIISGGIPGTPMTAYHVDLGGPFTPQEIERLVRYLRSLERGAPSVPEWRRGAKAEPAATAERPDDAPAAVREKR